MAEETNRIRSCGCVLLGCALSIIVLAFVLHIVIERAENAARFSQCPSNLRQLGGALKMFAADNNGEKYPMPDRQHPAEASGTKQWWFDQILPYTKSEGVFLCPSDELISPDANGSYPTYPEGSPSVAGRCSYIYRDYYHGMDEKGLLHARYIPGTPEGEHYDPSVIAVMRCGSVVKNMKIATVTPYELGRHTCTNYASLYGKKSIAPSSRYEAITSSNLTSEQRQTFAHSDGTIYLYMDGHVQWRSIEYAAKSCEMQRKGELKNGFGLPDAF